MDDLILLNVTDLAEGKITAETFLQIEEFLRVTCASIREDNWRVSYILTYIKRQWHIFSEYAGGVDFIAWAEATTGYSKSAIYRMVQLTELYFYTPQGQSVVDGVGGMERFCAKVPQAKAAAAAPILSTAPTEDIQDEIIGALQDPYVSAKDIFEAFTDASQLPSYNEAAKTIYGPDGTPWFAVIQPPPEALAAVLRALNVPRQQSQIPPPPSPLPADTTQPRFSSPGQ